MLRTNNKKVLQYFKSVIIQSFSEKEIEMFMKEYNEKIKNDYLFPYKSLCEFVAMENGGQVLISCWWDDMRECLKMALEETNEEANKYTNDQVYKLYFYLLERALFKVFEIEKIMLFNRNGKAVLGYRYKC